MDVIANSLFLAVLAVLILWLWTRPLFTGRWKTPGWFVGTAGLCIIATVVTWFIGAFAGTSMDPEESCHASGTTYDRTDRSIHWQEPAQWFPLHDKCNATYDLVPAWVNPALVLLPLPAITCLAMAVWLTVANRLTKSRTKKATAETS
ncbi:hypothetical protein [Streptomyces sp. NPDC054765]